ncbi:MAG TPA: histidine phosphatase family protein [Acidimicrobiales bacterium]|nr:histidine phosphatase family protein [Acidimicrobiales bacterium]
MDLLLVRHAEPVRIENAEGPADPPLSERGVRQAALAAGWLAGERLDAIWASPMRRARQTAEAIAIAHGLDVNIDDELAEFDRDAVSYIPFEELRATRDERYKAMVEDRLQDLEVDAVAFQEGVVRAVERVIDANPGGKIAVVCHGGVINAYTAHIAEVPKLLWFEPGYTSINRVAASRAGHRTVIGLNEVAHLRNVDL